MKIVMKFFVVLILATGIAYASDDVGGGPFTQLEGGDGTTPANSCTAGGVNGASCNSGACPSGTTALCQGSTIGQPTCKCQ